MLKKFADEAGGARLLTQPWTDDQHICVGCRVEDFGQVVGSQKIVVDFP